MDKPTCPQCHTDTNVKTCRDLYCGWFWFCFACGLDLGPDTVTARARYDAKVARP